jgi:hypothetical protein
VDYIVQLFIGNNDKIVGNACMEAMLSMCESTRVLECLKAAFPSCVRLMSKESGAEQLAEGVSRAAKTPVRWAEILFYLMRKGSSHLHGRSEFCTLINARYLKNLFVILVVLASEQV